MFPLSDNLLALILTVLADLAESQRERVTSTLALRGRRIQEYTLAEVREIFIELFCAPKPSLADPSLRPAGPRERSFCVLDQGELDGQSGQSGYRVEDDDAQEVGFQPEFEDVFWTFDDASMAWASTST